MGGMAAVLPSAISIGAKLMGGGGAAAAPAAAGVSPLTEGLMGMKPPMPERNPMMHSGPGDIARAKDILSKDKLMAASVDAEFDKVKGAPAGGKERSMRAFDSPETPWTQETGYGTSIAPQAPAGNQAQGAARPVDPPRTKQHYDSIAPDATPVRAATAQAAPAAPVRIDLAGERATRGQQFDTAPASPPGVDLGGAPKPAADGGLFGDPSSWLKGIQGKLKGMPTNPLGQVGLGLMASGYDGSNPYTNIQNSLGKIPGYEQAAAAASRADSEEERKKQEAQQQLQLALMLQQIQGQHAQPEDIGESRIARGAAKVIR